MGYQDGEDYRGLKRVNDMFRALTSFLLLFHLYTQCYSVYQSWNWEVFWVNNTLTYLSQTVPLLFDSFWSKITIIGFYIFATLGSIPDKKDQYNTPLTLILLILGPTAYFGSSQLMRLNIDAEIIAILYPIVTVTGYVFIGNGILRAARNININLKDDLYNELEESFPQCQKRISNAFSIHLPFRFNYNKSIRKGWINITNPFRGTLIVGNPGSGKSASGVEPIIKQFIEKGFSMYIYDYKFDDLTRYALTAHHNHYAKKGEIPSNFYILNFDNLQISHRCNPLDPEHLNEVSDAIESAKSIMLNLNKKWIDKQGEFFVESPINLLAGCIWALRQTEGGRYCTLPHAIELVSMPYEGLFPFLGSFPEVENIIEPFISAFRNGALEQLEGMVASARVPLGRLSIPSLYWSLSGGDFSLDINDPADPKILCVGNNPDRQEMYSAALGLINQRLIQLINKKNKVPSGVIIDELPTVYVRGLDNLIATARSNKVAVVMALQDLNQLWRDYPGKSADVIFSTPGNLLCGQATDQTAEKVSKRLGKIVQQKVSVTKSRSDTTRNYSTYLDYKVPPSKITDLSKGEFVGKIAGEGEQSVTTDFKGKINLKHSYLKMETPVIDEIPPFSDVDENDVNNNYISIKNDIRNLLEIKIEEISNDEGLRHLLLASES